MTKVKTKITHKIDKNTNAKQKQQRLRRKSVGKDSKIQEEPSKKLKQQQRVRREKNNKNHNKNHRNRNQNCSNKNKAQEIMSYQPSTRETKGSKKTVEGTNPDGEKDALKFARLDGGSTSQEIIDAMHEFNVFCEENGLYGDYECSVVSMSEQEIEDQNKVLEKMAKSALKHWRSLSKDALRTNQGDAVSEAITDATSAHSKSTF